MPTIRELLESVESSRATTFSVAGGSPAQLVVDGAPIVGPVLSEKQLNAIVDSDLNQDQQTDLMVGRPVGLSLKLGDATWRVLVQPMPTGIMIRGTREGIPAGAPPEFAPPPQAAAPVVPAAPRDRAGSGTTSDSDAFGLAVSDDDEDEDEDDFTFDLAADADDPPTPPPGALDAFDSDPTPRPVPDIKTPPPPPNDAFGQDDGFGLVDAPKLSAAEREITLFEVDGGGQPDPGQIGHDSTLLTSGSPGGGTSTISEMRGDQDGQAPGGGANDGTLIMQHAPRVKPAAPAALDDEILLADSNADHPMDSRRTPSDAQEADEAKRTVELPRAKSGNHSSAPVKRQRSQSSGTLMAMRPPGMQEANAGSNGRRGQPAASPSRSPSRSIPRQPTGQFPRSDELEVGALCFCREFNEAFEAGGRMGMGVEVIGESDIVDGRGPTVESLGVEPGATFIIQLDDPSRLLGWVLLRREEGFRVFVVTRATGPEGARRVLLGVHATDRAEAWLNALPVFARVGGVYQPI